MVDTISDAMSAITRLPPLTIGNLALALLGLPGLVILLGITETTLSTIGRIAIHWALALLVLAVAIVGENQSVTALGFKRPAVVDLGYILGTSLAILFVYAGTPPLVEALGLPVRENGGLVSSSTGFGTALAYAVTIGIVEEILYRGYPIERLFAYTDSAPVAGGVTWIVFTAVHALNWPLGSLLQTAFVAAILTVVYLRRRSLVPVIGAHILVWVFAATGQFYA